MLLLARVEGAELGVVLGADAVLLVWMPGEAMVPGMGWTRCLGAMFLCGGSVVERRLGGLGGKQFAVWLWIGLG